jgi:hypothetical protein
MGLGAAGPKSARFGEPSGGMGPTSEIWYIDFALQAGIIGLLALAGLVAVAAAGLWRRRMAPVAKAALALGFGLGAGAILIPVIDEPTVAIPLWALIGLGLATPAAAEPNASPETSPSASPEALPIGAGEGKRDEGEGPRPAAPRATTRRRRSDRR